MGGPAAVQSNLDTQQDVCPNTPHKPHPLIHTLPGVEILRDMYLAGVCHLKPQPTKEGAFSYVSLLLSAGNPIKVW